MRFRFRALLPLLALPLAPLLLSAQDEGALRRYFEGRLATVRLDMPGTEEWMEGKYRVSIRTYKLGERRITGEFVEGVLVSIIDARLKPRATPLSLSPRNRC